MTNSISADEATLAFYQSNAANYVGVRPDEITSELPAFLARLRPGARILELGCGNGIDAREMERRGFSVDATDGVATMAALANEHLTSGARVMRFDQLDANESYDAVVAFASLLHVPIQELPAVLGRIWRALRPGGWHFASFKTDGLPGWDKHGRYYNFISRTEADAAYRSAGTWSEVIFDTYRADGYFSGPAQWLTITAQKEG